ncbi:ABC transporter permease [Sphingobacterium puteale]|uniref:ABC transporter permease n=1 Tax=Sphingobacterium puteale TaxID=2420510 RepID=UPI003D95BAFB
MAGIFTALTIFVSCLGLFGLAAYMVESRTKEISIRKIHGASVFSVARMLSGEFVLLVCIACLLAFPIAYWAMNSYIQEYAYRIGPGWEIFAMTGTLAIGITILTVGYQSIRTSLANPVDSLRDE